MDISSISPGRYPERSFNAVRYDQPRQAGYSGGAAGPSVLGDAWGAGPLPGSNRPAANATWLEQPKEMAELEMIHVSEKGMRRLSKLYGMWELQSWAVKRAQDQQNSAERQAEASRFLTRSAIASMTAMTGRLATAGQSIDIYA
ncbi:MAG: hypothetical protein JXQ83_10765 [Candidatus Glassbacteria bacterium]|nr:hypothetical protein [Candidatus Glassbacteria bacterium]